MSVPLSSSQWGDGGDVRTVHLGQVDLSQHDTNSEKVDHFASLMQRGTKMDPVLGSYKDGRIVVHDGHHRVRAALKAGRTTIKVRVY